jgi:hypothetical protein
MGQGFLRFFATDGVTSGAKLTEKRRFEFAEASRTDERFPVAFS